MAERWSTETRELVANRIRAEALADEYGDHCLDDEDACWRARVHMGSQSDGVVYTVYANPDRLAELALDALADAGLLIPPGGRLYVEATEDGDEHSW